MIQLTQMMGPSEVTGLDLAGRIWAISAYAAHEVELTDELTGEVKRAVRVALLCEDGAIVSTCSQAFVNGFKLILQLKGAGPWEPAICVKVRSVKAKKQGHYLSCCLATREQYEAQLEQPKTKKK